MTVPIQRFFGTPGNNRPGLGGGTIVQLTKYDRFISYQSGASSVECRMPPLTSVPIGWHTYVHADIGAASTIADADGNPIQSVSLPADEVYIIVRNAGGKWTSHLMSDAINTAVP